MKYKKNNIKYIVYILLTSLFLVFLFIEISLRLFMPQPTLLNLRGMIGHYYAPSNFNTFELKKNYKGSEPSMERPKEWVSVNINNEGVRETYKAKDTKGTIVVLGDSYTFGVYVNDFDTYPSVLSKLLEKEGSPYKVINAGYASGFGTDEQYAWLNHYYINKKICPKFVILGLFSGNDILQIDQLNWRKKDEYGMPLSVINNKLIVTEEGYIRNKERSDITVGTALIYKIPVINNLHSFVLAGRVIDKIFNNIFKKGGVGYSSKIFEHYYGIYSEDFLEKEKKIFQIIEAMKVKLEKCGSNLIVVDIPINFVIEPNLLAKVIPNNTSFKNKKSVYHERLERKMLDKNIDFINITKTMLKDYSLNKNINFYPSVGEVHFNENGNYHVAEKIKEHIINHSNNQN